MHEVGLTIVALITLAIIPLAVGLPTGMQRSSRLVTACVAAAVIGVLWAIYWKFISNPVHNTHAILFVVLAIVALVAASFSRPQVAA
jgi:hypothetical protein